MYSTVNSALIIDKQADGHVPDYEQPERKHSFTFDVWAIDPALAHTSRLPTVASLSTNDRSSGSDQRQRNPPRKKVRSTKLSGKRKRISHGSLLSLYPHLGTNARTRKDDCRMCTIFRMHHKPMRSLCSADYGIKLYLYL